MTYPTLCTLLPGSDASRTLETAIACARRFDSHLDVMCIASPMIDTSGFMPDIGGTLIADTIEETRAELRGMEAMARLRLEREDIAWAAHALMAGANGLHHTARDACRFADLAVMARPDSKALDTEALFDAILFGTGLPILLSDSPEPPEFEHVSIAWDSSDQALAATRAALPLLDRAKTVSIVMVDPPQSPEGRFANGECLATFLSRHGIDSDIDLLPRSRARVSDVLRQHVTETRTNLLVMGAYGHSRLRESILGGVSRDMIQKSGVPLFLAR